MGKIKDWVQSLFETNKNDETKYVYYSPYYNEILITDTMSDRHSWFKEVGVPGYFFHVTDDCVYLGPL